MSGEFRLYPGSTLEARREFGAAVELERRLRSALPAGDVQFSQAARALYATDASNYRQVPIGVVTPRDAGAVEATLEACRELGAPVLPRGAGTSLAGQGCNVAVVLDFTPHMNRIAGLDAAARRARVEPGLVLDRLREAAERHQLTFAPDPATHSRCTLGGMIGNNSCGVHSLLGGKTVDNVESLDIALYDGTRLEVGATSEAELDAIVAAGGRRGELYAGMRRLRDRYAGLIREKFPRLPRRVSGYNLDELLPENGFNVARALVGAEGTCATVLAATLRLTPSPPHRGLVGLGFADPFAAADRVPALLAHQPIGLEGFDGGLIDMMRAKRLLLDHLELLPAGRGVLLAEFGAWSEAELKEQLAALARGPAVGGAALRFYSAEEAAGAWRVRESALGATAYAPGQPKRWEGWEDAAVAPERLGAYLRALDGLLREYGYSSPFYGHFGEGCVHLRVDFDLESAGGVERFREFLDRAADQVVSFGGSLSGEHGDGQARGALLPRMFGAELMQAFVEFKRLWDPENRMNPGKMIAAQGAVLEPHQNLRLGPGYAAARPAGWFGFASDGGAFGQAVERCVGVGACRKQEGTMCPSYMATGEERYSTRGRTHLLWELMHGELTQPGWENDEVRDALDLCLGCKACKTECPAAVDVATYKAEFLAHYYRRRRRPARQHLFGRLDTWARLASWAPGISNRLAAAALATPLRELVGLHAARSLPRVMRPFTRGFQNGGNGRDVILWPDTFHNYFDPAPLEAAVHVLRAAGFAPRLPPSGLCCGRPLYDSGQLDRARRYLVRVLDALEPALRAGTPIVPIEPGCASVFSDELVNLLGDDPRYGPRAAQLRAQTALLGDFLRREAPEYTPRPGPQSGLGRLLVQAHCHQRALTGLDADLALLRATGAEVELLETGCCGMAGAFGYQAETFAVSEALAERQLLPRLRAEPEATIVAAGFSCRQQIAQLGGRKALHPAEVF